MIRFEEDGFVISIKSSSPFEDWVNLHNAIASVSGMVSSNNYNQGESYELNNLLCEMMPDWQTAKKISQRTLND